MAAEPPEPSVGDTAAPADAAPAAPAPATTAPRARRDRPVPGDAGTPSASPPPPWPARALAALAALGVVAVVVGPLLVVTRVPLIDLPFHAAFTAVFAHHGDPAWGFDRQFELDLLGSPQLSLYALGAALSAAMPLPLAMKAVVAVALLSLPAGLAFLGRRTGGSALVGVLALGLVWSPLTHWGFVSFVAALGLTAFALGVALDAARTGSRSLGWGALATFVAVFVTHPSRAPFALLGLGLAATIAVPPRQGLRTLGGPLVCAALLLGAWWLRRPAALAPPLDLTLELSRLRHAPAALFLGFEPRLPAGAREQRLALEHGVTLLVVAGLGLRGWVRRGRAPGAPDAPDGTAPAQPPEVGPAPPSASGYRPRAAVAALALVHLAAFLTLPMTAGDWWYVFPRELPAAAYLGLALVPVPALPQRLASGRRALPVARALFVALPLLAAGRMSGLVAGEFRRFEAASADFEPILAHVPPRPRLLYLVFDRSGTDHARSPFLHFPAWVQAERGGWLSFHFAGWGFYPVRYRAGADTTAPPAEARMTEFHPQHFRVEVQGRHWDTFLVRHHLDPSSLFAGDPTIRLAAREGKWWLYRREAVGLHAAMRP